MNANQPITEDDLQAYVDGALDPVRRTQIDACLDTDLEAAHRVEAFTRQRTHLRAALALYAEEAIPPKLNLARLAARQRRAGASFLQDPIGLLASWRVPAWASKKMITAAFVLFCTGAASGWVLRAVSFSGGPEFRPLAQEAAENYRVYEPDAVHPVEIKADGSDELVDWVSSRLQRRVSVPRQVSGFHLLGGRVVSTYRGPAAMFMYDDGHGVRVVFMVCPNTIHNEAPMTEGLQGELGSVSWSEDRMGYSLVGATSAEKLEPLAEAIRRAIQRSES